MTAPAVESAPTRAAHPFIRAARAAVVPLLAYAGGLALLYGILDEKPTGALLWVDVTAGALACLVLLGRTVRPVPVTVALVAASALVASAGVANVVALYAVARNRRLPVALVLGLANVLAGCGFWLLYPRNQSLFLTLVVNVAISAAVVAWGALRQAQQRLLVAYRERAERAEAEQYLRAQRIRAAERTRIAREMHDGIANRISLVALHAGGLSVARGLSETDVRQAAETIQSAARSALDELRDAIGVLRTDEPDSIDQPGVDRLADLARDSRAAGQPVDLSVDPSVDERVPASLGRDLYRIVQEGLTNAQKHAPGAHTSVEVTRPPGTVVVRVRNGLARAPLDVPGAGAGLIGLQERAALCGGTIRYGPTPDRENFELRADLPWT